MSISENMNCIELSDLEEGEILEYDTITPGESRNENHEDNSYGYINKRLKEKLKLRENIGDKSSMADLESISSEEEYKFDQDEYSIGENEYYSIRRKRKGHSSQCYGTVEDIMSEIGETICRKSRCNYKKRKSKEVKEIHNISFSNSYDLWRRKIFSSHLRSKNQKRKTCSCHSDSDSTKSRMEKRKKRKRRDYEEEEEKNKKKLKLRDFDEMRLNLLEKLKKQKAEEVLKASNTNPPLETESSEIQEVDMLIDSTNYVDDPTDVPENSTNEKEGLPEKEGEDDLDLVKLRLIALASNKRRKDDSPDISRTEDPEGALLENKSEVPKEEVDLDRSELLLRAEALKTALLKKYQRRLNRMNVDKSNEDGSLDTNNDVQCIQPQEEETVKNLNLDNISDKIGADACKENLKVGDENGTASAVEAPLTNDCQTDVDKAKVNQNALVTNAHSKKIHSRGKIKRKKRKPVLPANNLKENNEKTETLEEDDSTLRTQLLSDLMKKKCLKDQEKKSVLMDSSQTSVNKPLSTEPPKDNLKPLPAAKKSLLKKVNVPKTTKPVAVPKFPKPDIQRIIVHLGSEDSSDEDIISPQPAHTQPQEKSTAIEKGNAIKSSGENKRIDEVIQASYEKSVELLLSQARKKIEREKRAAASAIATPEAVYKHLPPSQRLEYIRLKQKIAERESQRNQKKENVSGTRRPDVKETTQNVSQKPKIAQTESKSSNLPKSGVVKTSASNSSEFVGGTKEKETNNRLVVNKIKSNVNKSVTQQPGNGLKSTATSERSFLLLPSSQALITKLKLLLKKIKMEKIVEENYEREMSKLRNQLSLTEKKKCAQGLKIKKLWEESMKTYKAIQGMSAGKSNDKAKTVEKEKISKGKEEEKKKEEKKENEEKKEENKKQEEEEEGKNGSDEPESELCKAQSKGDKEVDSDDKLSESVASGGPCLLKYDSPLEAFNKVSDGSERVDPNVMMCQFDLMGVCKDEDCAYQHLRIMAK